MQYKCVIMIYLLSENISVLFFDVISISLLIWSGDLILQSNKYCYIDIIRFFFLSFYYYFVFSSSRQLSEGSNFMINQQSVTAISMNFKVISSVLYRV